MGKLKAVFRRKIAHLSSWCDRRLREAQAFKSLHLNQIARYRSSAKNCRPPALATQI
jgi:hypothetical protein